MAWTTIIHKNRDKIVLVYDGEEIANIVVAKSSKTEVVNISVEAHPEVGLRKVAQ